MSPMINCPNCGHTLPATTRFCENCGNPLSTTGTPGAGTVPPVSQVPLMPQQPAANPYAAAPPYNSNPNFNPSPDVPSYARPTYNDPLQQVMVPAAMIAMARNRNREAVRQRQERRGGCLGCGGCLTTGLIFLLLLFIVGSLFLADSATHNGEIIIHDDAHVLNTQKISAYDGVLGYDVMIYTTKDFSSTRLVDLTGDARTKAKAHEELFARYKTLTLEIDTEHQQGTAASEMEHKCNSSSNSKSRHCYDSERPIDSQIRSVLSRELGAHHDYTSAILAALQAVSQASDNGAGRAYGQFVYDHVTQLLGSKTATSLFEVGRYMNIVFWIIVVIAALVFIAWLRRLGRRAGRGILTRMVFNRRY